MAAPLVAVTGATGFVGRRLVPILIRRGWRVRALVRRAPPPDLWGEVDVETVRGDLADEEALARLMAGAEAVVHAAGLIKARTAADFAAVNVEGTRRIAGAAAGRRLIVVSSLVAREPTLSDYAASKHAAEAAARAGAPAGLTILRPPAIYGPSDRETFGLFRMAAQSPVLVAAAPAAARLALAHVDDVAGVIAGLIEAASPPAALTVSGARPEGYSWREMLRTAALAVGREAPTVTLPGWAVRGAARLSATSGRWTREPPIFTPGKAREILHLDWSVSKAERGGDVFAYRSLGDGFAQTAAWCREHGWLR